MPLLSEVAKGAYVRVLGVGASGAGKTGSLVSLVKAGYKLRIYDLDTGLDALVNQIRVQCPDKIDNVQVMHFRDQYTFTPSGSVVKGTPRALGGLLRALEKWEDGSDPSKWGQDTVVVIDSLTALGRAAYAWAKQLHFGTKLQNEKRQHYQEAQDQITSMLDTLTGEAFATHVIVFTHIDVRKQEDGTVKGWPSAIGEALGPKIPAFFNTMLVYETTGTGTSAKRKIRTMPTMLVDAKNPAPQKIEASYDIGQLDVIFSHLRNL